MDKVKLMKRRRARDYLKLNKCHSKVSQLMTKTRMKDPRSAPTYPDFRVGDLAFFLLVDITKIPFEQMLPYSVKFKIKDEGVYAYFEYVEHLNNRKALQNKWRAWWAKHGS